MNQSGFYLAFEDRFRGPRELVLARLRIYLRFVEPLVRANVGTSAVDLGCGRGEWLELLQQHGFSAVGIDIDDGMLAACTQRGIAATKAEAIPFLQSLPNDSQSIVSGFHLAEHLPFHEVRSLVEQALRVLKPGGLLILETPNPENIVVGATSFYLDPTHQRPLHPTLLAFLPEYYGFERTKILRLQESPRLLEDGELGVLDVLGGASPDYAIVAQKSASGEILQAFDESFSGSTGVELHELAGRYDAAIDLRFGTVEQRLSKGEEQAALGTAQILNETAAMRAFLGAAASRSDFGELQKALTEQLSTVKAILLNEISMLNSHLKAMTERADRHEVSAAFLTEQLGAAEQHLLKAEAEIALLRRHEEEVQQRVNFASTSMDELRRHLAGVEARGDEVERARAVAEERAVAMQQAYERQLVEAYRWWRSTDVLTQELKLVYGTTSWRLTAPLRWVRGWLPHRSEASAQSMRPMFHRAIGVAARYVQERPRLRRWFGSLLDRFPNAKRRIKQLEVNAVQLPVAKVGETPSRSDAASPQQLGRATSDVYGALSRELVRRRDSGPPPTA